MTTGPSTPELFHAVNKPEKPFRPLLAATLDKEETLKDLIYPLAVSPKVDGIRVHCHPTLGPITRSSKPVPNAFIRTMLASKKLHGFDGEVVSGDITAPNVFNVTTSAVMTHDGTPDFTYWVFDTFNDQPFIDRLKLSVKRVCELQGSYSVYVQMLPFFVVNNPKELLEWEMKWLAEGYEGIMLRKYDGPYKQGRSTLKEQTLLKLKRFKDAEAIIIGFEPLYRNENPQTRSAQGLAKRSDHQGGLREVQTLGALRVRHAGGYGEFAVGSGFDSDLRDLIWRDRDDWLGKTIKFKYQEIGTLQDGKPRFPIYLGLRGDE